MGPQISQAQSGALLAIGCQDKFLGASQHPGNRVDAWWWGGGLAGGKIKEPAAGMLHVERAFDHGIKAGIAQSRIQSVQPGRE